MLVRDENTMVMMVMNAFICFDSILQVLCLVESHHPSPYSIVPSLPYHCMHVVARRQITTDTFSIIILMALNKAIQNVYTVAEPASIPEHPP